MSNHLTHHLCLTHSARELEDIKEEAYSRPEAYPMERFTKLSAWLLKVLEDLQDDIARGTDELTV